MKNSDVEYRKQNAAYFFLIRVLGTGVAGAGSGPCQQADGGITDTEICGYVSVTVISVAINVPKTSICLKNHTDYISLAECNSSKN
jgi:hypothetical protein